MAALFFISLVVAQGWIEVPSQIVMDSCQPTNSSKDQQHPEEIGDEDCHIPYNRVAVVDIPRFCAGRGCPRELGRIDPEGADEVHDYGDEDSKC